ncbi:hypothetical protein [Streptomyces sp. NPDC057909]|uniref:hypothetical protein n=1 Tax=Streptomyces sp. NPDC057909 TaxID=3346277 RepID=UPI0036F01666
MSVGDPARAAAHYARAAAVLRAHVAPGHPTLVLVEQGKALTCVLGRDRVK